MIPGQKVCGNCLAKLSNDIALLDQCSDPFKLHRYVVKKNLVTLIEKVCKDYSNILNTEFAMRSKSV